MPLHVGKKRTVSTAISEIIDYVKNDAKTDRGRLITSYECDSRMADAEFYFAKQQYIRTTAIICTTTSSSILSRLTVIGSFVIFGEVLRRSAG